MIKVRENHGPKTTKSPIKTSSSQLAGNYWAADDCPVHDDGVCKRSFSDLGIMDPDVIVLIWEGLKSVLALFRAVSPYRGLLTSTFAFHI